MLPYVEDEEVKSALREYGDLKSQVIRLKYKQDLDLAALANGNCLVKRILDKHPSHIHCASVGNGVA